MVGQLGNLVVIEGRRIPAINIQVDNVPGFIKGPDGEAHWYGVYFEIMFPDGALWEVNEGADENEFSRITVTEYDYWAEGQRLDEPNFERTVENWIKFLEMYDAKLIRR